MEDNKRAVRTVALLLGGAIFFAWLLQNYTLVGGVFSFVWALVFPFVLGFVLAFLLNLPTSFIENHLFKHKKGKMSRTLSLVLAVVLVLGALGLLVGLLIPALVATFSSLADQMPQYIESTQTFLEPYLAYLPQLQGALENLNVDWESLLQSGRSLLQNGAGSFVTSAWGVAGSILGGIVSFFIGIIFAFYLLSDKEHLTAQLQGFMLAHMKQERFDRAMRVARLTAKTYRSFIAGQCLEALLVGTMFVLALWIGGFDYALLIGVLIGFCSLIPLIGGFIGCGVGVLLILVSQGLWRGVAFVVVFLVLQQLDGDFIYPKVVGKRVGLPAIWVLFAVTVGGSLGGIVGILLLLPLCSVLYTLLHQDTLLRLEEKGIEVPAYPVYPKKQNRIAAKIKNWWQSRKHKSSK